jgi:hypothetical protein
LDFLLVNLFELVAEVFSAEFAGTLTFLASMSFLIDSSTATLEAFHFIWDVFHGTLEQDILRFNDVAIGASRIFLDRFLNSLIVKSDLSGIGLRIHHHGFHLTSRVFHSDPSL